MLTQSEALALFEYRDGVLYWKKARNWKSKAGDAAGTIREGGYVQIRVAPRFYRAHQIVWLMHYGYIPRMLDHINGNTADNRIENLRECTNAENQMNNKLRKDNKSGHKGVCFHKASGKWRASIVVAGKQHSLGYFLTPEEAAQTVSKERRKYHGEFTREG